MKPFPDPSRETMTAEKYLHRYYVPKYHRKLHNLLIDSLHYLLLKKTFIMTIC